MEPQDGTSPESIDTSTEVLGAEGGSGPEATAGETPAQQPTGINPAWLPLREAIGEDFFEAHAMPVLKGMDESAHTRITNLSSELQGFEGYKPFVEQGVTPESLQQAMELAKLANEDPRQLYARLGEFLGETPVEDPAPTLDEFGAGQDGAAEIPPHIMARLEQAETFMQQQQLAQVQQQQEAEQARIIAEESTKLDQEMATFLTNNPSFTEADKGELFRAQHELTQRLVAQGVHRIATLAEAAQAVNERAAYYRQRAGGGAAVPGAIPTTAGGDIPGQQPNTAKMSKQQMADLVAADIAAMQAQS